MITHKGKNMQNYEKNSPAIVLRVYRANKLYFHKTGQLKKKNSK